MPHPTWFDWITVAAIVIGPILALLTQRILDWMRREKDQRLNIYLTLMSLRATWLDPQSVRAFNSIDTVFSRSGDKPIRDAWAKVIAHSETGKEKIATPDEIRAWNDRMLDLRVDLYQAIGSAVGFDQTVDYIKTRIYVPQLHADIESEWHQIRKQLSHAITNDGIKIIPGAPLQPLKGEVPQSALPQMESLFVHP